MIISTKRLKNKKNKGIALFIAVIVTSAILLISLSIADISFKEQILTYSGKDSKVAFYAADSGLECALYHDIKKPNFYFATNNSGHSPTLGLISCNGVPSISVTPVYNDLARTAVTTFSFDITGTGGVKACSIVSVTKTTILDSGGNMERIDTKIDARGYNNNCTVPNIVDDGDRNLERELEMNY